ncbi:MAG: DUF1254 domain-containing protein, partial [Clostridia bacterium]|nr:DUF1254 domain-containing protein [Clostridia bacterium]
MLRPAFIIIAIAILVVSATASYSWRVRTVPYEEMQMIEAALTRVAGDKNAIGYGRKPTHETRIVKNNPDTRTAFCWYDVTDGPVVISATSSPSYWSLSLYDRRSENFFVMNNQQASASEIFEFVLYQKGSPPPSQSSALLVPVDDSQGAALMRYFVPTEDLEQAVLTARSNATCQSLQQ